MLRLGVLLALASALPAQYFDFAADRSGTLYFATSLTTGALDSRFKVYRLSADGLLLFATGSGPDGDPFGPSAIAPLTSGDGAVTGYAINYPCRTGSCGLLGLPRTFFQLQGAGPSDLPFNSLQVSRNGRFLFGSTFVGAQLIELPGQKKIDFGQLFNPAGTQSVSDAGAVLLRAGSPAPMLLYRAPDSDPQPIPGTDNVLLGILSPDGAHIAYVRDRDGGTELVVTDPRGAAHRVVASARRDLQAPSPSFTFAWQPSFADDGTLFYIDPADGGVGQPAILTPGGEPRRVANLEAGVQRAILSGDGRIAWVATYTGQILRVHTADGSVEEAIPGTPYLSSGSLSALPGSVVRMFGSGLPQEIRFQLGDTDLPLSEVRGRELAIQVPWESVPGAASSVLTVRGPGSPFLQRFDFSLLNRATITFERDGERGGLLQAAHQDFHGVVTATDPAQPGETLHVFARNMGPVDQPVATGQPSPTSPPARVTTPMACYLIEFDSATLPVRSQGILVPFAGLAGKLIGIYQIDVTIPAGWRAQRTSLTCNMEAEGQLFRGDLAPIDVAALN
jgi:uncharacterized protein (TIGR03437 family)